MKARDILVKAGKIEDTYIIIDEPNNSKYGHAVRLAFDPYIEISKIDTVSKGEDSDFSIKNKRYKKVTTISIKIDHSQKLIDAITKLVNMEVSDDSYIIHPNNNSGILIE